MKNETRKLLEDWLRKHGFTKKYGHDIYLKGQSPHMRKVNLEVEPPWVGISSNIDQTEADQSEIAEIHDVKTTVLEIYNTGENPVVVAPVKKEEPKVIHDSQTEDIPQVTTPGPAPIAEQKSSLTIIEDSQIYHDPKDKPKPDSKTKHLVCAICEKEVEEARILDCVMAGQQVTCKNCKDIEPKEKTPKNRRTENMPDSNTPATIQKPKAPAVMTDAQRDEIIELAKAERYLKSQGGSYTVSGRNRPDSAMVQKIANSAGISVEILVSEQTKDYAHVVVRGHRGQQYVDAVVHHDFETEFQLMTMEILKKNSKILDHFEGSTPIIKEGATIEVSGKVVDAKYHLIHALLNFKTFSLRDATTKAMSIVQMKLLNQDSRSDDEIASEQKERDMVEDSRKQKGR